MNHESHKAYSEGYKNWEKDQKRKTTLTDRIEGKRGLIIPNEDKFKEISEPFPKDSSLKDMYRIMAMEIYAEYTGILAESGRSSAFTRDILFEKTITPHSDGIMVGDKFIPKPSFYGNEENSDKK